MKEHEIRLEPTTQNYNIQETVIINFFLRETVLDILKNIGKLSLTGKEQMENSKDQSKLNERIFVTEHFLGENQHFSVAEELQKYFLTFTKNVQIKPLKLSKIVNV